MTSNHHSHLPNGGDRTHRHHPNPDPDPRPRPHPHPRPPSYPPASHGHYIPASAPSSSSSAASFKGCCCCLFLLLIFLALLAVAAVLVVVLVVRPKKPQFDLNQVAVTYLLVSPTPAQNSAYLTLNLTLLFTAQNPNKVEIRYDQCVFYVMYHGVPLGVATVPGFRQPAHSSRLVQTRVSVSRFDVMQADAMALVKDAAVNDRVELRIAGDVGAKIRVLGYTSPRVQVAVDCAIVISPRRQSLTYKQCGVDGLNV